MTPRKPLTPLNWKPSTWRSDLIRKGDTSVTLRVVLERLRSANFEATLSQVREKLEMALSSNAQTWREWIAALNKIESLNPRAVIAGHKRPGNDDSPKIIEETRQYIRDFERLAMQTTTVQELYDQMLKLYPDWINRGALWTSVRATKT